MRVHAFQIQPPIVSNKQAKLVWTAVILNGNEASGRFTNDRHLKIDMQCIKSFGGQKQTPSNPTLSHACMCTFHSSEQCQQCLKLSKEQRKYQVQKTRYV